MTRLLERLFDLPMWALILIVIGLDIIAAIAGWYAAKCSV